MKCSAKSRECNQNWNETFRCKISKESATVNNGSTILYLKMVYFTVKPKHYCRLCLIYCLFFFRCVKINEIIYVNDRVLIQLFRMFAWPLNSKVWRSIFPFFCCCEFDYCYNGRQQNYYEKRNKFLCFSLFYVNKHNKSGNWLIEMREEKNRSVLCSLVFDKV